MKGNEYGKIVEVTRCLKAKPFHSGEKFGWVLDYVFASSTREDERCSGIGKVTRYMGDGYWAVWFIDTISPPKYRDTVLFVHQDHMRATTEKMGKGLPSVDSWMHVCEGDRCYVHRIQAASEVVNG